MTDTEALRYIKILLSVQLLMMTAIENSFGRIDRCKKKKQKQKNIDQLRLCPPHQLDQERQR